MFKPKIFATLSVGIVILGFTMFPFIDWAIKGVTIEPSPAMNMPLLWICPLFAIVALFIQGKASGWSWISAGVIGIGILVSNGLRSMNVIIESANKGFIGRTIDDVLSGNTPPQVIEKLTFGTGFYVLVFGLLFLVASGIWDIVQKRKQMPNNPIVTMPVTEEVKTEPKIVLPPVQDEPTDRLKKLKDMLDKGLISQEDYEAKKAEILSKI